MRLQSWHVKLKVRWVLVESFSVPGAACLGVCYEVSGVLGMCFGVHNPLDVCSGVLGVFGAS